MLKPSSKVNNIASDLQIALTRDGGNLSLPDVRVNVPSLVENLYPVSADKISAGLGFNITGNVPDKWAFQMAKDAGAIEVRFQPGWEAVESYDNPGTYALPAIYETALQWCKELGLHPLLTACYGPPRRVIQTVTVASDVAIGSYDIPVVESISTITPISCHIQKSQSAQIVPEGKWAYYGALIKAVDTTNKIVSIATKTNVLLTAGTKLIVNKLLYPSIMDTSPNDPSTNAYCNYVSFLASRIAAYGLEGRICVWNEPLWSHDQWDYRVGFYDDNSHGFAGSTSDLGRHMGIITNLMNRTFPDGVRLNNGSTDKTAFATATLWNPTKDQILNSITYESFHPYGDGPELTFWYPDTYNPVIDWATSNYRQSAQEHIRQKKLLGYGITLTITETGFFTTDDIKQTRFCMRQFLGFHALGVERVNFYALSSGGDYSFVRSSTNIRRSYYAIQQLMKEINHITGDSHYLLQYCAPRVVSYSGSNALMTVPVIGKDNNCIFFVWQRNQAANSSSHWADLPDSTPQTVQVRVTEGSKVIRAWNTVTGVDVPITVTGEIVSYLVGDDPIGLILQAAVPSYRTPTIPVQPIDMLPAGSYFFPFNYDARSSDRRAMLLGSQSPYGDRVLTENRIMDDDVMVKKFKAARDLKFYGVRGIPTNNCAISFWIFQGENETSGSAVFNVVTNQAAINGANGEAWVSPRNASMRGNASTYVAACMGTYPIRGKWHHYLASWGPAGSKLYIDGMIEGINSDASKAFVDVFTDPIIGGSTRSDTSYIKDMLFVPFQPTDAQVLRWSNPNHVWQLPIQQDTTMQFSILGSLAVAANKQERVSPYFCYLKRALVSLGTAPASDLTLRVVVRTGSSTDTGIADLVVTAGLNYAEIQLATPVLIRRGDRITVNSLTASGADANITLIAD